MNIRKIIFKISITAFLFLLNTGFCICQENPRGAYMGQKPPGMTPEIFAQGFISTNDSELNSVFTPDGKEFYFASHDGEKYFIKYTKQVNGIWTTPVTAPFSGIYSDVDISISYDGKRCFFGSSRPVQPGGNKLIDRCNLWMMQRVGDWWGEPVHLKNGINAGDHQNYPCSANNGNLYFQSVRDGNVGESNTDIHLAEWKDGYFSEPVNLGENINSIYNEGDVLIAPDESWIIISVSGSPECIGSGDFFISFRKEDGSWMKRIHMGEEINTKYADFCPMISPDGKYLFYTSKRTFEPRKADIYWADIKIIEKYRPKRNDDNEN